MKNDGTCLLGPREVEIAGINNDNVKEIENDILK